MGLGQQGLDHFAAGDVGAELASLRPTAVPIVLPSAARPSFIVMSPAALLAPVTESNGVALYSLFLISMPPIMPGLMPCRSAR